jgi:hypothetical protein
MTENKIVPRPEFPNPQFVRKSWLNLNGEWEFESTIQSAERIESCLKLNLFRQKLSFRSAPKANYREFTILILLMPCGIGKK